MQSYSHSKKIELEIRHTNVYSRNRDGYFDPRYEILFNQGGTGSSKTWSIIQLLIYLALAEKIKDCVVTIVRKTLAALRATAMKDFFIVMRELNLYHPENHNKSEHLYSIKSVEFEFSGLDQPQKKRGAKRAILWINEANEINTEDWQQLNLRTSGKIFIDFNPSDEFHFLYEQILNREDCLFIQSSFRDNPFLEARKVREILRLKDTDPNYWRVYGLGERGVTEELIYKNVILIDKLPEKIDEVIYGMDFGFNNPTTLVEINLYDGEPYMRELIYQSGLTNKQVIDMMNAMEINKRACIYCDGDEGARIQEYCDNGYNAFKADKSVKDGIDFCKRMDLKILKDSINGIKELRSYKWKKDKDNRILDEPVKLYDHFADGMRYALYTHLGLPAIKPNIRLLG